MVTDFKSEKEAKSCEKMMQFQSNYLVICLISVRHLMQTAACFASNHNALCLELCAYSAKIAE